MLLSKTGFDRDRACSLKITMTCIFVQTNFRAQGDVYRLQSKLETSQSEADRLAMDLVKIQLIIFNL